MLSYIIIRADRRAVNLFPSLLLFLVLVSDRLEKKKYPELNA